MNGQLKQWLLTLAAVAAVLFAVSRLDAAWLYEIEGEFAPSFVNSATAEFEGTMLFPTDSVTPVTVELIISGEAEPRIIQQDMSLNLPRTALQPWDTRLYAGMDSEAEYATMVLVNYGPDANVGTNLLAELLDEGGGWDGWAISLHDYSVGSISSMHQVNEPAAYALLVLGAVIVAGMSRNGTKGGAR